MFFMELSLLSMDDCKFSYGDYLDFAYFLTKATFRMLNKGKDSALLSSCQFQDTT